MGGTDIGKLVQERQPDVYLIPIGPGDRKYAVHPLCMVLSILAAQLSTRLSVIKNTIRNLWIAVVAGILIMVIGVMCLVLFVEWSPQAGGGE